MVNLFLFIIGFFILLSTIFWYTFVTAKKLADIKNKTVKNKINYMPRILPTFPHEKDQS